MRFSCAALMLASTVAHADILIDNVKGASPTPFGQIVPFTALLIGDDGKIIRSYAEGEKRPDRAKYRIDAHGATMLPGQIAINAHVIALGLTALAKDNGLNGTLPPPGPRDRDLALDKAQSLLLAQGITTVADMGTSVEDWLAFRRAGDEGRLRIRIICYAKGIAPMIAIGGGKPSLWLYNDHLRMSGVMLSAAVMPVKATAAAQALALKNEDARLRNEIVRAAMDGFQVAVASETPADAARVQADFSELLQTFQGDVRWRNLYLEQLGSTQPSVAEIKIAADAKLIRADNVVGPLAAGDHADFRLSGTDSAALSSLYIDGQLVSKRDEAK